ncbi:MAG: hypothetical protein ACLFTE_01005 [Salinivenus sp.]
MIDYSNDAPSEGDWIKVDSLKMVHIGKRDDAKKVKHPLPSEKVFVDSVGEKDFSRDYNPKSVPFFISRHLQKINEDVDAGKKYSVKSHFLISQKGAMIIEREDSSKVKVSNSEGYPASVEKID